jgi:hypothetical protein
LSTFYANNDNGAVTAAFPNTFDPPEDTDIVFRAGATRPYIAIEANIASAGTLTSGNSGGLVVSHPIGGGVGNSTGVSGYAVEGLYLDSIMFQFRQPRQAITPGGTANRNHLVYWDMNTKSIKYHQHTGGTITLGNANYNGTGADVGYKKWINIDGGADRHEWPQNGTPTANQGPYLIVQYATAASTPGGPAQTAAAIVNAIYVDDGQYVKVGTPLYTTTAGTRVSNREGIVMDTTLELGAAVTATPLYVVAYGNYANNAIPASNNATTSLYSRVRPGNVTGVSDSTANHVSNPENLLRTSVTGMYASVAVTYEGWPRVVYFDQTNQRPRLAYANLETPTGSNFKSIYVLDENDPNYKFAGKFSAIKVQGNRYNSTETGNRDLHIVLQRTMGASQLLYVKLTWDSTIPAEGIDGQPGGYKPGISTIVDNTGSVGSWMEMYLDNRGMPWVSYIDMSRKDFYDGVKIAYLSTTQFPTESWDASGALDAKNTGWEYMNVPARFTAKEARTGIATYEAPGTGTNQRFWQAAVGYLSDDYFRIAYYMRPITGTAPLIP